jgi:cell division protein FtsB
MPILEKIIRFGAVAIAVLFVGLSLFGIFGAWFVDRKATDVALNKGLQATVSQHQKQIEALTADLEKLSAGVEANKPAPKVVNNP